MKTLMLLSKDEELLTSRALAFYRDHCNSVADDIEGRIPEIEANKLDPLAWKNAAQTLNKIISRI